MTEKTTSTNPLDIFIVGVRKGIVKTNNTYNVAGPAYFFSANSS